MLEKEKKDIHFVDLHVGQRMRARRIALGMDQDSVASSVGVSFQQIQKYERGTNRVSASRLFDIAQVLKVPIDYFFTDLQEAAKVVEEFGGESDPMSKQETQTLAEIYWGLDAEVRHHYIRLLAAMARSDD
ncbi:MAG: helix-turn-helix domain-containing protein [Rhodospirillaceae bacterium]